MGSRAAKQDRDAGAGAERVGTRTAQAGEGVRGAVPTAGAGLAAVGEAPAGQSGGDAGEGGGTQPA